LFCSVTCTTHLYSAVIVVSCFSTFVKTIRDSGFSLLTFQDSHSSRTSGIFGRDSGPLIPLLQS
jgi:hypothetical protein